MPVTIAHRTASYTVKDAATIFRNHFRIRSCYLRENIYILYHKRCGGLSTKLFLDFENWPVTHDKVGASYMVKDALSDLARADASDMCGCTASSSVLLDKVR